MADTVVTSNEGYRIDIDNASAYSDKAFKVSHDNGTELFRVQEDGNVGVGVTSPTYPFQVSKDGTELKNPGKSVGLFTNAAVNLGIHVGYDSDNGGVIASAGANKPITFWTYYPDYAERVRITGNGAVGIGTSSPGAKLDVSGDAKISGNLAVDTNVLFVDTANDRVGIGTASPSSKLDVSGDIEIGSGDAIYIGDPNTNNSLRIQQYTNAFSFEKRIDGNWNISTASIGVDVISANQINVPTVNASTLNVGDISIDGVIQNTSASPVTNKFLRIYSDDDEKYYYIQLCAV
ncbi:MAG: hypothetical protein LHV68_00905 [Elusimicrobia bacterium]|nr:hypothetical protein [Candidatus Liberimonas magnetica]